MGMLDNPGVAGRIDLSVTHFLRGAGVEAIQEFVAIPVLFRGRVAGGIQVHHLLSLGERRQLGQAAAVGIGLLDDVGRVK